MKSKSFYLHEHCMLFLNSLSSVSLSRLCVTYFYTLLLFMDFFLLPDTNLLVYGDLGGCAWGWGVGVQRGCQLWGAWLKTFESDFSVSLYELYEEMRCYDDATLHHIVLSCVWACESLICFAYGKCEMFVAFDIAAKRGVELSASLQWIFEFVIKKLKKWLCNQRNELLLTQQV